VTQHSQDPKSKEYQDRFQTNLNCRYYVRIGDIHKAVFSDVSGLQMETEIFEFVEGGNNGFVHRLPGLTKAGNITLKRGITRDNELFKWYSKIAMGIMDLRTVEIDVYATDKDNSRIITWSLQNAFPVKWSGPQFAANGLSVAVESIELAHMGVIYV